MNGGIPLGNKIMSELKKIIDFRDENGFIPFNFQAQNLQNFKVEIFLIANQDFDGWSLRDNTLFFECTDSMFEGGMSTILALEVDDNDQLFKGVMSLNEYQFELSAHMLSEWDHPYGMK